MDSGSSSAITRSFIPNPTEKPSLPRVSTAFS